jgi:hypothetical protein
LNVNGLPQCCVRVCSCAANGVSVCWSCAGTMRSCVCLDMTGMYRRIGSASTCCVGSRPGVLCERTCVLLCERTCGALQSKVHMHWGTLTAAALCCVHGHGSLPHVHAQCTGLKGAGPRCSHSCVMCGAGGDLGCPLASCPLAIILALQSCCLQAQRQACCVACCIALRLRTRIVASKFQQNACVCVYIHSGR